VHDCPLGCASEDEAGYVCVERRPGACAEFRLGCSARPEVLDLDAARASMITWAAEPSSPPHSTQTRALAKTVASARSRRAPILRFAANISPDHQNASRRW